MSPASSRAMTLPSSNEKLRIDKALTAEPKNCKDLRLMGSDSGGDSTEFLTTSKCVDETFIKTCLHEQVPVVCWTRSLGKFF